MRARNASVASELATTTKQTVNLQGGGRKIKHWFVLIIQTAGRDVKIHFFDALYLVIMLYNKVIYLYRQANN